MFNQVWIGLFELAGGRIDMPLELATPFPQALTVAENSPSWAAAVLESQ